MKLHPVQEAQLSLRRYLAPADLDEVVEHMARLGPRARLIAGGSDLLLELSRGQHPSVDTLIDLSRLPGGDSIIEEGSDLVIGPTVTHNQAATSPLVQRYALPLAQACWEIGSPQLRNRATIAGNVITASPANDTISALRALGASVEIRSRHRTRVVDLASFHTGVRRTVLKPGEVVTALRVRKLGLAERGLFVKLGLRRAQAISVVHLAAVVEMDGELVGAARIALGSVAPTIVTAPAAEAYLAGRPLDSDTIAEAARRTIASISPIDDVRATAEYRRQATEVMVRRALTGLQTEQERALWPEAALTLGKMTNRSRPSTDLTDDSPMVTTVNGTRIQAPGAASRTLLDWLREEPALTGTKEGCAEGECGACTVYLDGAAVMACLIPAGRAFGAEITTIEGLTTEGALHPLQEAFVTEGAVQCGFCIPGFLMAGAKLLEERARPSRAEIVAGLAGNLCRCTGYHKIIKAVEEASRR